jgi:hypothetical protein
VNSGHLIAMKKMENGLGMNFWSVYISSKLGEASNTPPSALHLSLTKSNFPVCYISYTFLCVWAWSHTPFFFLFVFLFSRGGLSLTWYNL